MHRPQQGKAEKLGRGGNGKIASSSDGDRTKTKKNRDGKHHRMAMACTTRVAPVTACLALLHQAYLETPRA